jgi:hypothetical protein
LVKFAFVGETVPQTRTIQELKQTWEIEKETFRSKELGGLQGFVENVLLCDKLFALKQGYESTKIQNRKNEITRETRKDGGRGRADFVIYISGDDVVIPVEVEAYGNIKAGESQILQYQTDWRKKYGILTDGNEWRLYFDRWYETFYLADILNRQSRFWEKWEQYISAETYYNMAFNAIGQQELFEAERLDPCKAENRPFFFNDITNLLRTFKTKIADLFPLLAQEERQIIEITYSYIIQFILYKVLIDNNYKKLKNDYETFREWVKKAVQTQKYDGIIKDIQKIAEYIYKNVYEPFRQKQESINKRLLEQVKAKPELDDIAPWLDIIMFIDRYNFADLRNEIFGFVYENYLKELYHDENKGQYFTDPAVVNFMLEELGYTKEALAKTGGKNISIIDPSCGAGTFLYSAALAIKEAFDDGTAASSKKIETLVNNNIFGLDIEEFPLFLAEMNILMQLLPIVVNARYSNVISDKIKLFITKDSIAEFLDTPINTDGANDKDAGKGLFDEFDTSNTPPYMRNREDIMEMFNSLEEDLSGRRRFDYVIGNPPYIGYNECSKQGFSFIKKLQDKNDTSITMGNVYGVNLNTVKGRKKPYSPKPNLYAFFISLGLGLLKENGKICYIIPQTMLTAGDLDVLRYHLAKYTTIEKIITFPNSMFIGRGLKQKTRIATSSLVFIAKKTLPKQNHVVKVVNYKPYTEKQEAEFNVYFRSRNKQSKNILQMDLLNNINNWNLVKQDDLFQAAKQQYELNSLSIEEYRQKILSHYDEITIDGGVNLLDEKIMRNIPKEDHYKIFNPKANNYHRFIISKEYLFYSKKSKIGFIPGGQGMKAFENKYKIIWKTRFNEIFQFSEETDLLLKGNQSLVLSSDNKPTVLFLFSILNSPVSMLILREMLKIPNEATYIVPITAIKQYIRIPKITKENEPVKNEIIEQTEKLLALEKPVLQDFVDFPKTSMQTFDFIRVAGNALVLTSGDRNYTAKICPGKNKLAADLVAAEYFPKGGLVPEKNINLESLRFLPAIDFTAQAEIKSYIDDLVFALYFNVPLPPPEFEKAAAIHAACEKNEFYSFVDAGLKSEN